jgi:hypothetical protein
LNCWPWSRHATVRRIDWRTDLLDRKFDYILGADILYDRADLPFLDRFWRFHLHDTGRVLLSDPCRPLTSSLLDTLPDFGWACEESRHTFPDLSNAIRVVKCAPVHGREGR